MNQTAAPISPTATLRRSPWTAALAALTALALFCQSAPLQAGRTSGSAKAKGGGSFPGNKPAAKPSGGAKKPAPKPSGGSKPAPKPSGGAKPATRPSGGGKPATRPSGGGGNVSRPSGSGAAQRPSGGGGNFRPSGGGGNFGGGDRVATRPSGGRVPSRPGGSSPAFGGGDRFSGAGGAGIAQLPAGNRPGGGGFQPSQLPARPGGAGGFQPSQLPARPGGPGGAARPGQLPARPGTGAGIANRPAQRPSTGDLGNFLGLAAGVGGGIALADRPSQLPAERAGFGERPSQLPAERPGFGQRPSQLPAERPGFGQRPSQLPVERPGFGQRPSQLPAERPGVGERPGWGERPAHPIERPGWGDWSENRGDGWQERVDHNWNAWNERANTRIQSSNNFYNTQYQSWNNLESWQNNWDNWNRDDWGHYRENLWDYRTERAEEIRDYARDYYDDVFDDRWWGAWDSGWPGHYPANPWWWWRGAAWSAVSHFVSALPPQPVYIDYGANVVYEGDTVYVDRQPQPAAQYVQPMLDLAINVEQPPPPLPPVAPAGPADPAGEWLPLGVFALAQEEKGEAILFFQLSVNRAGLLSGAYRSTLTDDERPVAGEVDKASQRAAWRIGDNTGIVFLTSLANLTQDVAPVEIHWDAARRQTWLLVRMPEPAPPGQPAGIPKISKTPPPLGGK